MSWKIAVNISSYFTKKYTTIFNQQTQVVYGTGDNLDSMVGIGLLQESEVAICLGTSDTLFGVINEENLEYSVNRNINIFCSPLNAHQAKEYKIQMSQQLFLNKVFGASLLKERRLILSYHNFSNYLFHIIFDNEQMKKGFFFFSKIYVDRRMRYLNLKSLNSNI